MNLADNARVVLYLSGAFCDWALVGTFIRLGYWMDHEELQESEDQYRKKMHCYGALGIAAAITHILSIHPLFIGVATSWAALSGITVAGLVPTFILYIWFSAADRRHRPS